MPELTPAQRQLLAQGLSRPSIPGSDPIMQPSMEAVPYALTPDSQLAGLPPAVAQAIAPNIGINFGIHGDFVRGTPPPFASDAVQPMINIKPPVEDQSFERKNQPWWNSDQMLKQT